MGTLAIQASGKSRTALDTDLEMTHPAFDTEVVTAYVVVDGYFLAATDLASANYSTVEVMRTVQSRLVANVTQMLLVVVVILLAQVLFVPFKLSQ